MFERNFKMIKRPFFLILISSVLLLFACQTQSEDVRFEHFFQTHQKVFAKHFPKGKYELNNNIGNELTDNELFMDIQFCNEQLDKLARFDLENLSEINLENWKLAFANLKKQLSKIENLSNQKIQSDS